MVRKLKPMNTKRRDNFSGTLQTEMQPLRRNPLSYSVESLSTNCSEKRMLII